MNTHAFARKGDLWRFSHRFIQSVKSSDRGVHGRFAMPSRCISVIFLLVFSISQFESFAAIWPTSAAYERRKRLVMRTWLPNAESVTHWIRSASTSRRDWMVCPTKCTRGCCTCLSLFWQMCSTTGLPGSHPWSHHQECYHIAKERRSACLRRVRRLQVPNSAIHWVKNSGPGLEVALVECCRRWFESSSVTLWRENRSKITSIWYARSKRRKRATPNPRLSIWISLSGTWISDGSSEDCRIRLGFRKWISILYYNTTTVVYLSGNRSVSFVIEWSVLQDCPLSPLLDNLPLKSLLRWLGYLTHWWRHRLCVLPLGHNYSAESGCEVRVGCRSWD